MKSYLYVIIKQYRLKNKEVEKRITIKAKDDFRPYFLLFNYLKKNNLINEKSRARYLYDGEVFCSLSLFFSINYYCVKVELKDDIPLETNDEFEICTLKKD